MSSLGRHPDWQAIIIRTPPNSFSNMSKTGKNLKNLLYIRYKLKIRYIKKSKIDFQSTGSGSVPVSLTFDTLRSTNACVVPMLHAVQAWL
jgi:hypothetical protein